MLWRGGPRVIAFPGLVTAVLLSVLAVVHATQLPCKKFSESQRILIGRDSGNVVELHIRHNIQGEVEIRDGAPGEELIKLEIDKTAAAQSLLENVITNRTIIDIGYGTVYMLQVDYTATSTRIVTIIISAVIAAVIFLALLSVLVWWYCKVERQRFRSSPALPIQGLGPVDPVLPDGEERYVESNRARENDLHNPVGMPPPPPPRRVNGSYTPQSEISPTKTPVSSGGVGSPRGMSRTTVVTLSIITAVSVVYAGCSIEPQVHIIVFIPPIIKLHSVKLFFNKIHENPISTMQWSFKNTTELHVFDLLDASPTVRSPCHAEQLCPDAHRQNLGGCDAATSQCICQRGYELSRGICSDIDECSTYQHSCPSTATCRNTIGSYVCQCGYGYFGQSRRCKACSTGCPAGTYESSPCGTRGDRACSACAECKGSMYEVRTCGSSSDRQCMHAAHPLLITGEETTPTYLEGLKVEASDNVFLENLHSTRNLETTYYVTDMTQASDFYWIRESGLQVNIGILNVNLIPEYQDEDHESDNDFMIQVPGETEDKIKFRKIIRNQCRNPIPDHYSLTLEISRDRITAAGPYMCDSKDDSKPKCPPDHQDGEQFLNRSLNRPCTKMGTFPEPLDVLGNSYVCTQNSGLLNNVFNVSFTTEREIRFPPRRCRSSSSRCEQCLTQHQHCTQSQDSFDQQCCQIDCYTLKDCKMAHSEHCASAPVECAMGDAYRYTIQPMFENIKNEFQCHIKRKQPEVLYQMFYYIMLPDRKFETPRVYKTVYAHDMDYQSQGSFVADYLTVEHNTGLNLNDDFVLIGRDVPSSSRPNYTIHSLKKDNDFNKKHKGRLHKMSHNVFVAPVQVATPFAYSTGNWAKGNFCEKDVNNFKTVQPIYKDDPQNVNLMLENVGAPFRYFLKSQDNPPYMRFLAPGNTSVLPWYFRDNGPILYTNESLQATLELPGSGRIWIITIRGKMSSCPGYLGVTINNRLDLEELFRYDTLIFCPAEFNLTFRVPNWGQDPDKTFDIHLEDAKKSYDIYLTHMLFEQDRVETGAEPARQLDTPQSNLAIPAVMLAIAGVVLMMLLIVYSYLDCTKAKLLYHSHNINIYHSTTGKSHDSYCLSARNLSQGQVAFIVLYTVVRFLYSLLFTFTVFFALLMLLLKADFLQLSHLSSYQAHKVNASRRLVQRISDFGQDELLRQARLVTDMQGACSFYIEELFEALQQQMDNVTNSQHRQILYNEHSSISFLMHNHVSHRMGRYKAKQDGFTSNYQGNVDKILSPELIKYSKYLKSLYNNDWFEFPQLFFNNSPPHLNRMRESPLVYKSNLSGTEVDFAVFMDMDETELISLLLTQFWQRYLIDSPVLPQLPLPRLENLDHVTCDLPPNDRTDNITTQSPQHQLDASRFFAPHLPDRQIRRTPLQKASKLQEEYRYLSEVDSSTNKDVIVFSVQEFVDNIDTHLLKILFLVLDILIILYRISRTYITATTLCRGFEDTVNYKTLGHQAGNSSEAKESEMQNLRNQAKHGMPMEHEHRYLRATDTMDSTVTDYTTTTLESQKSMLPPPPAPIHAQHLHHRHKSNHLHAMPGEPLRSNDIGTLKMPSRMPQEPSAMQQKLVSCRTGLGNALQSTIIPKLLIACVLLLLFYMILTVVNTVFSVQTLEDLQGFSTFLAGLDIQVNQTNSYLQQQANHFNDITMKIYENQMKSELLHLQSMLEYFNSEQKRLVSNYVSEACAVKKGILGNRPCDIQVNPMQLTIPMLPCNFVPIQPQLYRGFRQLAFEAQLGSDFMPFLTSAKNITLKTGYAIIAVAALMFLIHISGLTLFHYLKTRHKYPVHRVYVTSSLPVAGATGPHQAPPTKESDSESDDTESGFKSFSTRVRMSPEKNYSKTETLLSTEFKYSETKV